MEKERISIIIPMHNSEAFIAGCIDSALAAEAYLCAESEKAGVPVEGEIILADDGSDDGSYRICRTYADMDPKIRLFRMQDLGVSAARNAALRRATGDYVTFLDADDRMAPPLLWELYRLLKENEASVAGCGFAAGTDQENWMQAFSGTDAAAYGTEVLNADSYIRTGLLHADTRVWSKLFRRSAIGKNTFKEGLTIGEDMLFLLDVMLQEGAGLVRTDAPYYFYWQNPKGAMARPYTPSYMDQIRCWEIARKKIASARPALLKEPETEGLLSLIDVVSALLVSSKIARLPDKERKGAEEDFQTARRKVKEGLLDRNARAVMPPEYRIKAELLKRFPRIYESLYQGRTK